MCLSLQPDLRLAVPLLVGVSAVIVIVLACILLRGERGGITWSPVFILFVALTLRLLFVAGHPTLSDDIHRYVWDGLNVLGGTNPYAFAPSAALPTPGSQGLLEAVNHPDLVTIYPPTAQFIFAAGASFGGITGLKAFLVLLDLLLCFVILHLLVRLDLPPWRAVLYAWNPLPVLEIASSGHIDGAAALFIFAAIFLLLRLRDEPFSPFRTAAAGGFFAASVLVKLFPLVFLPAFFFLCLGAVRYFLAGFCLIAAGLILPFMPEIGNALATLDVYLRNWEFAGFAFRILRDLTSGPTARIVLGSIFLATAALIYARAARRRSAISAVVAMYGVALAFLILTTTLHPWYALYLAALLPFVAGVSGLVLCWSVLLAYQVLIPYAILGQWSEQGWVAAVIFLAPALAWLTAWSVRSGLHGRSPRESSNLPASPR